MEQNAPFLLTESQLFGMEFNGIL